MKSSILNCIIAAAMLAAVPATASAQVFVGGSLSGAYSDSPSTSTNAWSVGVNPEVGYIMNSDWAFGARLSYGKSKTVVDSPYLHDETINVNQLTISPYAAYSLVTPGNLSLWAEAGLALVPKPDGGPSAFGAYLAPVLTYNLSRHFLLRSSLNILAASVMWTGDGGFAFAAGIDANDIVTVGNGLSVGFVYKF